MPAALSHPPPYHAQLTPARLRPSPMVGVVRSGTRFPAVGSRPGRGGRGDQPLVVEERAAEGALKEVVGHDVVGGVGPGQVLVEGQVLCAVEADGETGGVTAGHIAVLPSPVDLVLLLVE